MEEIARRLEATRREKGLTLEEIEAATHIRKKYLLALEQGRPNVIPGEVYLKGFLRSYGNYLGLDGEALVEEYKHRHALPDSDLQGGRDARRGVASLGTGRTPSAESAGAPEPERPEPEPEAQRPTPEVSRPAPEPEVKRPEPQRPPKPIEPAIRAPRHSPHQGHKGGTGAVRRPTAARKPVPHTRFVLRRILVGTVVLVPLVAGIWWWLGRPAAKPQTTPPPVAENPKVDPTPEPAPPKQEPEPKKPEVTMASPQGELVVFTVSESPINLKFEIEGTERRWMAVTVDGVVKFSDYITGPLTFQGGIIDVNAGNMNGVSLEVNGTRFDRPLEGGRWLLQFKSKS